MGGRVYCVMANCLALEMDDSHFEVDGPVEPEPVSAEALPNPTPDLTLLSF